MSVPSGLLALLDEGPRYGYQLRTDFEQRTGGAWPLNVGQVYTTLGRLERDGLVEQADKDQVAGPERVSYALTAAGRVALDEWLSTVEMPAPYVVSTLFNKVVVALLAADADRARQYLTEQRAAHMRRLRELTAAKTAPGAGVGDTVAADFAIAHLDADLRWLQTTLHRVADLYREVHA